MGPPPSRTTTHIPAPSDRPSTSSDNRVTPSPVTPSPAIPTKPPRRVQWNEQAVNEVDPNPAASEESKGSDEKGSGAASKEERRDEADPFNDRSAVDDVPLPFTRDKSRRGRLARLLSPVADRLGVFVDPLERDGLPSVPAPRDEGKGTTGPNDKRAEGLVRSNLTGKLGFFKGLSKRRQAIRQIRQREDDENAPTLEEKQGREQQGAATDGQDRAGILSALLALQRGGRELVKTRSWSAASAASSLAPPAPSIDDSSDDEWERERFISRLRAKRAGKNALHATSSAVSSAGKQAAGSALHLATGGHFRGSHDRGRNLSASSRNPSMSSMHRSRSFTSLPEKSSRHRPLPSTSSLRQLVSRESSSPPASSPPHSLGLHVPHRGGLRSELSKRVRKLGDKLGLELDTERTRPNAARSGAGVFGGLVTSATGLAAAAAPSAATLAPIPTKPGYSVARSAPPSPGASKSQPSSPVQRGLSPRLSPSKSRSYESNLQDASRMSLHEMVREEEQRGDEEGARPSRTTSVGSFQLPPPAVTLPPSTPGTPAQSGMSAAEALARRRAKRKKPLFSLHVNDLPSSAEEDYRQASPTSPFSTTIPSPLGPAPSRPSGSASPTSAHFRLFGPRAGTPRSPGATTPRSPSGIASPRKDYFGTPPNPADLERALLERKAREEADREEKERERDLREWQKEKKRRRKQREKELKDRRVFITAHVAAIIERQEFILKLARTFMMFGAPSHRLESQIQATARVLELPQCHAVYLPGVMLINFGDPTTCTSEVKFLKQAAGLDMGKLKSTYWIYHKVIRDKISVTDAAEQLDELMGSWPKYSLVQNMLFGGIASAAILPSGFNGSLADCLIVIPLGSLLVFVQVLLARNDLYASLFEITIACLNAMIAGVLSYSSFFCFYSVAAGGIVLVLPGFIVLSGALELANRCIVSGAVRITYSILYALFLGFGLSIGALVSTRGSHHTVQAADYTNGQPLFRRDTLAMVVIGCAAYRNWLRETGFSANFFSGKAFPTNPALTSAAGAFAVGVLGNAWAKATRESAFVVMIIGRVQWFHRVFSTRPLTSLPLDSIFVQLPSGLANGGLILFASQSAAGRFNSFSTAIDAAGGLVRTVVGMTVGLFTAAAPQTSY
ncbi:SPOSA6832_04370, partial [Sporobolomyces salmonicolor]